MATNQAFFDNLKPGQVYNAHGEIAVIIDVLRSQFTDNIALYVRFVRNIGNARQYDILEITPERHLGVMGWQPATIGELGQAVSRRQDSVSGEIEKLVKFAEENGA